MALRFHRGPGLPLGTPLATALAKVNEWLLRVERAISGHARTLEQVYNVTDTRFAGGAKGDGIADDSAAFQAAHDAMPSTGGVIFCPTPSVSYKIDGTGATVAVPKIACNITKPNVWVVGDGALFTMTGWTQVDAALPANADTAGANVHTVFRFFGSAAAGGGVRGLRVTGPSTGAALVVGQARAKFVAIDGAANGVRVEDVTGSLIVGNVVNARGENTGAGAPGQCRRAYVVNVDAEQCAENGINLMGGTYDCRVLGGSSRSNGFQGLEAGTYGLEVAGLHASGNTKNGVSLAGRYATLSACRLHGNTIAGLNFQYNNATFDGSHHSVGADCLFYENGSVGVLGNTNTHDNTVRGRVWDNGTGGTGEGVKLASACSDYDVSAQIFDTGVAAQRYGVNAISPANLTVRGLKTRGHSAFGLIVQTGGTKITVLDCDFSAETVATPVSVSAGVAVGELYQRNNRGWNPTVAVASAATITLGHTSDVVTITGTTGITSITADATYRNRRVSLIFQGVLTVTDGSNLKLNGNFVTTADDVLPLICDGTNWYEGGARSAN